MGIFELVSTSFTLEKRPWIETWENQTSSHIWKGKWICYNSHNTPSLLQKSSYRNALDTKSNSNMVTFLHQKIFIREDKPPLYQNKLIIELHKINGTFLEVINKNSTCVSLKQLDVICSRVLYHEVLHSHPPIHLLPRTQSSRSSQDPNTNSKPGVSYHISNY